MIAYAMYNGPGAVALGNAGGLYSDAAELKHMINTKRFFTALRQLP